MLSGQVCTMFSMRKAQTGLCNLGLQQKSRLSETSQLMLIYVWLIQLILCLYYIVLKLFEHTITAMSTLWCCYRIWLVLWISLVNVNSSVRLSVVCLSVCRLSVTFVHPTQAIEIFRNISTLAGTLAIYWHPGKILRRSSQANPSVGRVKHKRGSRILRFWTYRTL